jgi:hypothetical protein
LALLFFHIRIRVICVIRERKAARSEAPLSGWIEQALSGD